MRLLALCVAFAIAGCTATEPASTQGLSASRVLQDGTPEAHGVITLLNDPSTTFEILDIDAALDRRAATNLIEHRDGPDGEFGTADDALFDTVDEIVAVPWVGDAAMQRLLDHAQAEGWILDETFYGRIEGVEFDMTQAEATLVLANLASYEVLDDEVPLDRRAANGIVERRPFSAVEEVAEVPFVGESALTAMRTFAETWDQSALLSTAQAELAIAEATQGLVWQTDWDDTLRVVVVPGFNAIDRASAQTVLAGIYSDRQGEPGLDERFVSQVDLARMFDEHTIENRFWGPDQYAVADQWRALRAIFESQLADATVLRLGEYAIGDDAGGVIDIYVLGATADGDLAGFHTIAIEP